MSGHLDFKQFLHSLFIIFVKLSICLLIKKMHSFESINGFVHTLFTHAHVHIHTYSHTHTYTHTHTYIHYTSAKRGACRESGDVSSKAFLCVFLHCSFSCRPVLPVRPGGRGWVFQSQKVLREVWMEVGEACQVLMGDGGMRSRRR